VPKGDKKKKKEITAEIALLEAQLDEKHNKENSEIIQNCQKVRTTE
jgi:OTU domain-containing protein 6